MDKPLIAYPEVFAAVGKFIAKKKWRDVCVMEFEGGMIVTGSSFFDRGESSGKIIETQVFSFDELRHLAKGH
jgi:hypothetical protein